MRIEEIDELLKASLPINRYEHSVNVMHEAVVLAERFGVNEKMARLAGLTHDCGRETANSEAPQRARELGLPVSVLEAAEPVLLHARIGVVLARDKYQVRDEHILRAIASHTTGGAGMSDLDMVVFLADYTEPGRMQKGVDKVRGLLRKSLELAMLEALKQNMEQLAQRRHYIHPDCIECWNYFVGRVGKEPVDGR